MSFGILAMRSILTADADDTGPNGAEARTRALHVSYVLNCPVHRINADRDGIPANSQQSVMDEDDWPDWLERISPDKAPIEVFRVLPQTPSVAPRQLPQGGSIKKRDASTPTPQGEVARRAGGGSS